MKLLPGGGDKAQWVNIEGMEPGLWGVLTGVGIQWETKDVGWVNAGKLAKGSSGSQ